MIYVQLSIEMKIQAWKTSNGKGIGIAKQDVEHMICMFNFQYAVCIDCKMDWSIRNCVTYKNVEWCRWMNWKRC